MKRLGLLLIVGLLAVAVAAPSGASSAGPVAGAAKSKKCKKKHGHKKKHKKKCKKKKKTKPPAFPALVIAPASWDFGGFPIGLGRPRQQFTATNSTGGATGPLSASISGANPGNFAISGDLCSGQSLAGGASCYLYVDCVGSGSLPATFNGNLLISGNPGGTSEAPLTCRQF